MKATQLLRDQTIAIEGRTFTRTLRDAERVPPGYRGLPPTHQGWQATALLGGLRRRVIVMVPIGDPDPFETDDALAWRIVDGP